MSASKLPLGIQDFSDLITKGFTYIDKTQYLYEMITRGKPYFISRPRRFGKSLTVSTLEAIFLGKRELFKDLWIDKSDWAWQTHPVIRLDMSDFPNNSLDFFVAALKDRLIRIAAQYNITINTALDPQTLLLNIIEGLGATQQVVVLVDEYDKPIIDRLHDIEVAKAIRDMLRQFYGVLKSQDGNIRFIFFTGVTKFSKVSIFSGLNNLTDITLASDYSALMGYTREELEHYFSAEIKTLADNCKLSEKACYLQMKEWYNGYQFSKEGVRLYNPYSILSVLQMRDFANYWFSTGTPTFLLELIKKRRFDVANIENLIIDQSSFESFEIEDIPTLALLYQTGYLTIKSYEPILGTYRLDFPNREVSQAFIQSLMRYFSRETTNTNNYLNEISYNLLDREWDYKAFFDLLNNLLALIPYDLYVKEEKYFHSLFYLIIKLTGQKVSAEVHTQLGRIDATIELSEKILIFEMKINKTAQEAIDQIKKTKYYEIYSDRKLPIYLVGINFDGQTRTIDDFMVELLP